MAKKEKKPPQWDQFGSKVFLGALGGLALALIVYCLVQWLVFHNFAFIKNMNRLAKISELKPIDIISMTATVLGGFAVGGAAVMQYRKHKFAEYQITQDLGALEREAHAQKRERLRSAIEHLGNDKEHIRMGAIYEFKLLVEDDASYNDNVAEILTRFLQSKAKEHKEGEPVPGDVKAAADYLIPVLRAKIETTPEYDRPSPFVFDACKALCLFKVEIQWSLRNAQCIDLNGINLKGAHLEAAHLEGARLLNTNLKGADLRHAHLEGTLLRFARLEGADFKGAYFDDKTFFCYATIDSKTEFSLGVREKYFDYDEVTGKGVGKLPSDTGRGKLFSDTDRGKLFPDTVLGNFFSAVFSKFVK